MITSEQINSLPGTTVLDDDGDRVGDVIEVYLAEEGGEPLFVTVKTGFFGSKQTFVPLDGADMESGGLHVRYDKARIKDAPRVDADEALSEAEQQTLFDYYDRGSGTSADRDRTGATDDRTDVGYDRGDLADDRRQDRTQAAAGYDAAAGADAGYAAAGTDDDRAGVDLGGDRGRRTAGHDASGPDTDDAMTISEERLHAGVERREAGRARLRKHVVTEQRTVTVPVSHEEVRLEREPITDENAERATDGPDLSDEEHEVVLTEERPVVQKETVPVERVRLGTETVTEEQQVTDDVRHEEVDVDGADTGATRTGRDR
ncbi:YsnF/AvaK domain-containing protein [Amnibacterium endophyticum]|uniref:YsnF/AvaK domain-containing protein n=1 Tax=Amnibacterium endophyticum TaxID=2109337 RepID=A0ABW4LI73_9MICO